MQNKYKDINSWGSVYHDELKKNILNSASPLYKNFNYNITPSDFSNDIDTFFNDLKNFNINSFDVLYNSDLSTNIKKYIFDEQFAVYINYSDAFNKYQFKGVYLLFYFFRSYCAFTFKYWKISKYNIPCMSFLSQLLIYLQQSGDNDTYQHVDILPYIAYIILCDNIIYYNYRNEDETNIKKHNMNKLTSDFTEEFNNSGTGTYYLAYIGYISYEGLPQIIKSNIIKYLPIQFKYIVNQIDIYFCQQKYNILVSKHKTTLLDVSKENVKDICLNLITAYNNYIKTNRNTTTINNTLKEYDTTLNNIKSNWTEINNEFYDITIDQSNILNYLSTLNHQEYLQKRLNLLPVLNDITVNVYSYNNFETTFVLNYTFEQILYIWLTYYEKPFLDKITFMADFVYNYVSKQNLETLKYLISIWTELMSTNDNLYLIDVVITALESLLYVFRKFQKKLLIQKYNDDIAEGQNLIKIAEEKQKENKINNQESINNIQLYSNKLSDTIKYATKNQIKLNDIITDTELFYVAISIGNLLTINESFHTDLPNYYKQLTNKEIRRDSTLYIVSDDIKSKYGILKN